MLTIESQVISVKGHRDSVVLLINIADKNWSSIWRYLARILMQIDVCVLFLIRDLENCLGERKSKAMSEGYHLVFR